MIESSEPAITPYKVGKKTRGEYPVEALPYAPMVGKLGYVEHYQSRSDAERAAHELNCIVTDALLHVQRMDALGFPFTGRQEMMSAALHSFWTRIQMRHGSTPSWVMEEMSKYADATKEMHHG